MVMWYPDHYGRKRFVAQLLGGKSADSLQLSTPSGFTSSADWPAEIGTPFWGQPTSGGWVREGYKDLTILASNRTLWWASVVPELSTRLARSVGPAFHFDFILWKSSFLYLPLQMLIPNKVAYTTNSFSHLLLENSISKSWHQEWFEKAGNKMVFWS